MNAHLGTAYSTNFKAVIVNVSLNFYFYFFIFSKSSNHFTGPPKQLNEDHIVKLTVSKLELAVDQHNGNKNH